MALEHRDCAEIDEMLPAYAVDALDDADRARVEAHLATCDRHDDVAAWGDVALRLADLAPAMTPPAALRDRILAIPSAPAEPASPGDVAPAPVEVPLTRAEEAPAAQVPSPAPIPPRLSRLPYALAAVFAAIAVFFGAWTAVLLAGGDEEGAPALAASASAGGIDARASFIADEQVVVVRFDGLDPLPAGSAYQLWAIAPGADPASAGILAIEDGHALASVEGGFGVGWTFAVTVEPEGGSPVPTTDPLVAITF